MLGSKKILALVFCATIFFSQVIAVLFTPEQSYQGGWSDPKIFDSDVERAIDPNLKSSIPDNWKGKGSGGIRLLYQDYKKVHGVTYVPRNQGRVPSCVGQAVAAAADFLAAVDIVAGQPERKPPAPAAAGVIYGLSRQEIGELGPGVRGGSMNIWGVQALQRYGVVARLRYPLIEIDLRQPSSSRALKYGKEGVPDSLERIAKLHPVKEYYSINSYEDLRDAICAGYPVVIGSKQGFGNGKLKRDKDGFLNPPRRVFFKSVWKHSMVCIGVCDNGRKGALILNSWGSEWVSGPHRFEGSPEGTFFVDYFIIDHMVKQKDSYAIRGFRGYREYRIWTKK